MSTPPAEKKPEPAAETEAARKETFLARYPRKIKLGALGVLIVLLILLLFLAGGSGGPKKHSNKPILAENTAVSGMESKAAIANSAPSSIPVPQSLGDKNKTAGSSQDDAADEDPGLPLTPAPDPGLVEDSPQGPLPRVGDDGRQPWQVYARPFDDHDKRPRLAIVITDLGLSRVETDAAIDRLPPNVTLAFDVQSPVVGAWCARARQAGHETLLALPMEPFDYPRSDPGPNTLLSNLPDAENIQRLQWALAQANGYIGVTTLSGTRLMTDPSKITPILNVIQKRGLMIFDTRVAPHSTITDLARTAHVPVAVNTQRLDQNLAPGALDEALNQIEQTARLNGRAVAMAPPLPIIIDRLGPWIKQLKRNGIVLAPLSAMAQ